MIKLGFNGGMKCEKYYSGQSGLIMVSGFMDIITNQKLADVIY